MFRYILSEWLSQPEIHYVSRFSSGHPPSFVILFFRISSSFWPSKISTLSQIIAKGSPLKRKHCKIKLIFPNSFDPIVCKGIRRREIFKQIMTPHTLWVGTNNRSAKSKSKVRLKKKTGYLVTLIKRVGGYLEEITTSGSLRNSDMSLGWVDV